MRVPLPVGPPFPVAAGALEGGLAPEALTHFASTEEAARATGTLVGAGDVVLVKASRGMALERVVGALKERFTPAPAPRT